MAVFLHLLTANTHTARKSIHHGVYSNAVTSDFREVKDSLVPELCLVLSGLRSSANRTAALVYLAIY